MANWTVEFLFLLRDEEKNLLDLKSTEKIQTKTIFGEAWKFRTHQEIIEVIMALQMAWAHKGNQGQVSFWYLQGDQFRPSGRSFDDRISHFLKKPASMLQSIDKDAQSAADCLGIAPVEKLRCEQRISILRYSDDKVPLEIEITGYCKNWKKEEPASC